MPFDGVVDYLKDVVNTVAGNVIVPWPIARAATDNSRCENAVSEAAFVGVFHIDDAGLEGVELCQLAEASNMRLGIASDVQQGRVNVVQHKVPRIA